MRVTNVALVAIVGLAAGHLLMPVRVTAEPARRLAFLALVASAGAVAGLRERSITAEYEGRAPVALFWHLAGGAVAALVAAALAWYLVHG